MIKTLYEKKFLKDLKNLKSSPYFAKIRDFCFEEVEKCENIEAVLQLPNIRKMEGFESYYRFRVGDYRIGTEIQTDEKLLIFLRVLHQNEIYKFFPSE